MIALTWICFQLVLFSFGGHFGVLLALLSYWVCLIYNPSLYEGVEKQTRLEVPFVKGTPLGEIIDFTYTIVRASYLLGNAPIYFLR